VRLWWRAPDCAGLRRCAKARFAGLNATLCAAFADNNDKRNGCAASFCFAGTSRREFHQECCGRLSVSPARQTGMEAIDTHA